MPDPAQDELLPINDDDWDEGGIIPSEPLLTTSFSTKLRVMGQTKGLRNTSRASSPKHRRFIRLALVESNPFSITVVPAIARANIECPLIAQCIYTHAAAECAWFIREDHEPRMYSAMEDLIGELRSVGESWSIAMEYLGLLQQTGVLKCFRRGSRLPNGAALFLCREATLLVPGAAVWSVQHRAVLHRVAAVDRQVEQTPDAEQRLSRYYAQYQ
ncbi:hypothetical protein Trco_007260 [Trichoderma cornu-damae]|uniref:Uncharacterized protein n=1 Tax=Trichoderma cornu-damae TaxID=654480 RepID=A0A9P8TSY1_9HYPO|nr:hypothetical protein Trco_007260 [Trichoderma cornu-damae]